MTEHREVGIKKLQIFLVVIYLFLSLSISLSLSLSIYIVYILFGKKIDRLDIFKTYYQIKSKALWIVLIWKAKNCSPNLDLKINWSMNKDDTLARS